MCGGVDTQKLKKCGPSKRVRGVGGVGAKNGTVFALLSMLRCGLRGCWWSLLSYWGWVWWSDRDEWGKVLKKLGELDTCHSLRSTGCGVRDVPSWSTWGPIFFFF